MLEYFKTCKRIAATSDIQFTSIKELTEAVAIANGYRRENVKLGNGKVVERTVYDLNTDYGCGSIESLNRDVLTAKWFLYYQKLFLSKLLPHPELKEYYPFILQRTYSIYFNALNLDKLKYDAQVTKDVCMTLGHRIGEALGLIGSPKRLADYMKKVELGLNCKNRIIMKYAINHMAVSYNSLTEQTGQENSLVGSKDAKRLYESMEESKAYDYDPSQFNSLFLDMRIRLKDNKVGNAMLEALLSSPTKVDFTKMDYLIGNVPKEYKNNSNVKKSMADAISIICNTLYDYGYVSKDKLDSVVNSISKTVGFSKKVLDENLQRV